MDLLDEILSRIIELCHVFQNPTTIDFGKVLIS